MAAFTTSIQSGRGLSATCPLECNLPFQEQTTGLRANCLRPLPKRVEMAEKGWARQVHAQCSSSRMLFIIIIAVHYGATLDWVRTGSFCSLYLFCSLCAVCVARRPHCESLPPACQTVRSGLSYSLTFGCGLDHCMIMRFAV